MVPQEHKLWQWVYTLGEKTGSVGIKVVFMARDGVQGLGVVFTSLHFSGPTCIIFIIRKKITLKSVYVYISYAFYSTYVHTHTHMYIYISYFLLIFTIKNIRKYS